MNKKALTETDIRSKFITPALVGVNGDKWNLNTQIREEVYFTRGRVIVRGKVVQRGEAKKPTTSMRISTAGARKSARPTNTATSSKTASTTTATTTAT